MISVSLSLCLSLSLSLSRPLSGVEAELLSDAAPVVVWRLVEAVEKHSERTETQTEVQRGTTYIKGVVQH